MNDPLPSSVLILGGARSGKSAFAEKFAETYGLDLIYLATGQAFDSEMKGRINQHQISRGTAWRTIEEPLNLRQPLEQEASPKAVILVDCLTLWVSNLMMTDENMEERFTDLCNAIKTLAGPVLFVSNEVGQGIVPDNPMARAFRDHAGRLHQMIAQEVETAYFITAGLPQKLK